MTDAVELAADMFGDDADTAAQVDDTEPESSLWVCPHLNDDGSVCGRDFATKQALNGHAMSRHGLTWDGKPTPNAKSTNRGAAGGDTAAANAGKSTKTRTGGTRPAATKATGRPAGGEGLTASSRPGVYAQSLATVGLLAHLGAGRWFDNYDLTVWTNGSVPLANALDSVGNENKGVRQACDMLLAGGTGGAYVQLILACAMIGVPIAAHHGWLPAQAGERFAEMAGVMAPTTVVPGSSEAEPPPGPDSPPAPGSPSSDPSTWTFEEWLVVLNQMPSTVAADLGQHLMSGGGPTVVTIPTMPGTEPMSMPTEEEHRGSVGANGTATTEAEPVSEPA